MSQWNRMPLNNRVSGSSALEMTGIWKNTIGYDPYRGEGEVVEDTVAVKHRTDQVLKLAKLSNIGNEICGACERCGMTGHLTFQCRNHITFDQKNHDDDLDSLPDELHISAFPVASTDKIEVKQHRHENRREKRKSKKRRKRSRSRRSRSRSRSRR